MSKMEVSDKYLQVTFDKNSEPMYKFYGAWNVRDLGHTRGMLFRAYKHYIRELRAKEEEK